MFQAKTVMTTELLTVSADTPIYEAISLMVDDGVTGIPVVDDEMTIIGIITEKDILKSLPELSESGRKVEEFMTTDIVSFNEDENLVTICECLINNHFRRVPILREGKLVGIISRKDIIQYILEPIQ